MFKIYEARSIVPVKVMQSNSFFTLTWNSGGKTKRFVYKGDTEKFTKFLRKMQAKDDETSPNSTRGKKYGAIVDEIISGKDNQIWVWSTYLDKLPAVINN